MSKDLKQRWEIIQQAGGPEAYIKKELKRKFDKVLMARLNMHG